jgi:hypothetical protein
MFELKPLDPKAVPKALEKAERYRLLNEPEEAESICLDILNIEPDNQAALITLVLALSDQFPTGCAECYTRAQTLLSRLHGEYERLYYAGILCERRGNALLSRGLPGSGRSAYTWYEQAMHWYEQAEAIRPEHNDDPILRWNTCARSITKHHLTPPVAEAYEPAFSEG